MNGANSACLLELDEENVRVANHHLKRILNSELLPDNSQPFESHCCDLIKTKIRDISKRRFDTTFYLATHHKLEKAAPGSGFRLLDEAMAVTDKYIVFRSAGYTDQVKDILTKNYGRLVYYCEFNPLIAPIMIFEKRD